MENAALLIASIQYAIDGIGMPEAIQKYTFEAFFRAHNRGKIPGTGLGLNMFVRDIWLMNSRTAFNRALNRGSSFTISFLAQ